MVLRSGQKRIEMSFVTQRKLFDPCKVDARQENSARFMTPGLTAGVRLQLAGSRPMLPNPARKGGGENCWHKPHLLICTFQTGSYLSAAPIARGGNATVREVLHNAARTTISDRQARQR
jgi:hypothetical protein